MLTILRFIHLVDPPPVWMPALTVALGLYGVAVVWMDPAGADSALGALLLWQMLSASRGFAGPASAGHLDPILIRETRWRIAIAHLTHSTGPVIVVWTVVGAAELCMGVARPLAAEPGRLASLVFVGAAAWALSLGTTRLVSGALWIGALVVLAVTPLGLDAYIAMAHRPAGPEQFLYGLLLSMVCPFLMIGVTLPMREGIAGGLAVGSLVVMKAGVAYIVCRSYPLEPPA
jgi:hypothetical protein